MEKKNYVYLVQTREFIRFNEQTYKIGRTEREPQKRLSGYPKGSRMILFMEVNNCRLLETQLKISFKKKFKQMKEYGMEYFNGNLEDMISEFQDVVENDKSSSITNAIRTVNVIENNESCEGLKQYDTNKKYRSIKPEINRTCQFCDYIFSHRYNLLKHIRENRCPTQNFISSNRISSGEDNNNELKGIILSLKKQIEELTEKQTITNKKQDNIENHIEQLRQNQIIGNIKIQELKQNPQIINNVLQLI